MPALRPSSVFAAVSWLALLLALPQAGGCATAKKKKLEAYYGPTESIVEVVAVLRRHVPDDTYRFAPAVDFTGRNVYRSSLLRLEGIERMHADALRSGYMDPVMAFAKGRALERLRAYEPAARQYREAARFEGELREPALRGAYVCEQIAAALAVGPDLVDPLAAPPRQTPADPDGADGVVAELEQRVALFELMLDEVANTHYSAILREEIERADEVRARYFVGMRFALPDGQLRALAELQRLVARHGPSKRRLRHLLSLASFYDELAHEYVAAVPPESLRFDPARFQELVDPASELYQAVATQDGTPEKLEASRRLEAFLAFTLQVDRDRFTP